ncbi:MAG: hypothetical protein C0402_02270 [Thermodesulfovibrio sp.]|nr:hypothetical protein [Thermodesulfovibrio sp.]
MKHPPYHLRINKSVDRFLLVEILDKLRQRFSLSEFTYYGFGGPYLEDCRLLHEYCCEMKLVSIENDIETFKRQEFHRFSNKNKLHLVFNKRGVDGFLTQDFVSRGKEVFWLDYINNDFKRFVEFMDVLRKVGEYSIVKITLPARVKNNPFGRLVSTDKQLNTDQSEFIDNFNSKYRDVLPARLDNGEYFYRDKFVELIPIMTKIAAEKALPTSGGVVFRCLNIAHYDDGTPMLSITGITCPIDKVDEIDALFVNWKFKSFSWSPIHKIDVPFLSIKEILKLESYLPTDPEDGKKTAATLGYIIDKDYRTSLEKLCQYEYFHKYYPRFIRASI